MLLIRHAFAPLARAIGVFGLCWSSIGVCVLKSKCGNSKCGKPGSGFVLPAALHSSAIHVEATATRKDLHFIDSATCDMLQRGLAEVVLEYEHLCSQSGDGDHRMRRRDLRPSSCVFHLSETAGFTVKHISA